MTPFSTPVLQMGEEVITKLNELLSSLKSEVPGTAGSFLVNDDGFVIASDIEQSVDHFELGRIFNTFSRTGSKFAEKIFQRPGIRYSIWNETGDIQFFPVNSALLLVTISGPESRPGLLLLRAGKTIEIMRELLERAEDGPKHSVGR